MPDSRSSSERSHPADRFDIPALDQQLAGTRFGGRIQYFPTIDSTNALAMADGARGEPDGSVYVADEQTAGRGRGDHTWHSEPRTGLYLSVLLRPVMPAADALWLSLIAGLAAHTAVLRLTGLHADIRWPNDLLLGPLKFGGILAELNADGPRVRHAVIGIGLNVNHSGFSPELAAQATSLRIASGQSWPRPALLLALLQALDAELERFATSQQSAKPDILLRFEAISTWARGKAVRVAESGGFTGTTAGLDASGFLLVQTSAGLRRVLSGGVRAAETKD